MNYTLDKRPGKKKYQCPACGHRRTFTRYIHVETLEDLDDNAGKCDRENNCAYHYTPKQFFTDNPGERRFEVSLLRVKVPAKPVSFIDPSFLQASMKNVKTVNNRFYGFLTDIFEEKAAQVAREYRLGNSAKWPGANVFWYIDIEQKIRYGKIMLYNRKNGKRIKKPYNHMPACRTNS